MLVILVNESEGKAWKRTRRVLAKYLPQIGSRVWSGHISEEGLKDLQQELKKVVSKSGSVACHRMLSRSRMELQWIAGKKSLYDEQGRYAFRTGRARKEYQNTPQGPYAELVYLTRALAALLHDIGKATLAFQGKLRSCFHHEEYRHDLVGFLMLRDRFAHEQMPDDTVFLQALKNREMLWPDGRSLFALPAKDYLTLEKIELKEWLQRAPLFSMIAWLVLTHHRLPDGIQNLEYQTHRNDPEKSDFDVAPRKDSTQAAGTNLPWQDRGWQQHLANIAEKILTLLETYPALTESLQIQLGDWLLTTVHYNRPLLIAADHLASIQCDQNHLRNDGGQDYRRAKLPVEQISSITERPAYANAYRSNQREYWGDSVPQHLLRVEKVTRKLNALLRNPQQFRHAALPKTSLAAESIAAESPYYWQQLLADSAAHDKANKPVFAAVLAETGSGKTLAGVRLLNAISRRDEHDRPQLRYTLALGLRSLTLQSGVALRDQAALPAEDFVTLVGGLVFDLKSPEVNATQKEGASESPLGRDNADFDDGVLAAGGKTELDPEAMPWLDCLDATMKGDAIKQRDRKALFDVAKDWLGKRGLKLMDTPVVACTVDHIAAATHACNGGDARMALRLFTSDLVLDEIDNYSAQDLVTLGKLCLMAGLAGRHVVLMSATMSPFVVQGLFDAWWQGLKLKARFDAPTCHALALPNIDARLILASNQPGAEVFCRDLQTASDFAFRELYRPYVERVCSGIAKTSKRRNLDVFPLTELAAAEDKTRHLTDCIYPEILSACRQLHQPNATSLDGVAVSVGFIRFNTAKQAWRYGRWLLQRDSATDDFAYRMVCYHAKHPRLVLGLMDQKLNRLNNRKTGSDWQQLPELQDALREAKQAGKAQLLMIVVTTTLQETGRDHDYDWAVLEPRSTRGEVQAAGRIRRHRHCLEAWPHVNVLLLSQPLRAFDPRFDAERYRNSQQNDLLLWGMPGIESSDIPVCLPLQSGLQKFISSTKLNICFNPPGVSKKIDHAEMALPVKRWRQQGLDSVLCLSGPDDDVYRYDDNPIGTLEHLAYFSYLSRDLAQKGKQSLHAYLIDCLQESALVLTRKHHDDNRFRASYAKNVTLYTGYQPEDYAEQNRWDGLLETFYRLKREVSGKDVFDKADVNIESISSDAKALFRDIASDIRQHFEQDRDYRPYEALVCELNYYTQFSSDNDIFYHLVLGFCLERKKT